MTTRLVVSMVVFAGLAASCGGGGAPAAEPTPVPIEAAPPPVTAPPDAGVPLVEAPEPEPKKVDPCDELSLPKEELTEPDYDAGKLAWKCAKAAEGEERFEVARFFYIVAHRYTNDPTIYYWIADSSRMAGDCEGAVIYYEKYLIDGSPDETYRQKTVQNIAQCEPQETP